MKKLDDIIRQLIPDGWSWTLYGECEIYKARAVLVSPDTRVQIGRDASTIDEAVRIAARDARNGAKE